MKHGWYVCCTDCNLQSQRSETRHHGSVHEAWLQTEHSDNDLTSAGRLQDRHLPMQGTVYWSCSVASDPVLGSAMVVTSFCVHPSAASTACRASQHAAVSTHSMRRRACGQEIVRVPLGEGAARVM